MKRIRLQVRGTVGILATGFVVACSPVEKSSDNSSALVPIQNVQLFALDCGRIEIDLSRFTQGNEYGNRKQEVVAAAFLIRHPLGDLMWDTGLSDALHDPESDAAKRRPTMSMPVTLASQLKQLKLSLQDIEYLSLSHSHWDHLGNANSFSASTFLVDRAERVHMFREEARSNTSSYNAYNQLENAKTIEFEGDYDVFGDGSVKILAMPGHTPGHTVLLVNLKNTGPVLLSGDLYHLKEARELRTVPKFNTDVAKTLASMDRFEAIASELGARVIIQHSMEDFQALPQLPAYLE